MKTLHPYEPNRAEVMVKKLEEQFITGALHWPPFFQSAYAGGGFTLGAGYATHVGNYNTVDFRGSYIETEFFARVPAERAPSTHAPDGAPVRGWRDD